MGMSLVTYNGYTFPDRSNFSVREDFIYDASGRSIVATRFLLRVSTIIVNESSGSSNYNCGLAMHAARQALSQPGCLLIIKHDGLGPHWEINNEGGIRDQQWGPKPRLIDWNPVGHTSAVEVTWECEFAIPICDGGVTPQFRGLSEFAYEIGFSMNARGYTTRRISGTIAIALTRENGGDRYYDSIDNYRDKLIFGKPRNFQRETDWSVSADKRSASFTIIDKEIESPNAWPAGVVDIQADHRVNWSRASNLTRIYNSISCSVELSPFEHKSRGWMIFRDLVQQRMAHTPDTVKFIQHLDVSEEVYGHRVSFQMSYYFLSEMNIAGVLQSGLFQPVYSVLGSADQWLPWDVSMLKITPFQGSGFDRSRANLSFRALDDKLTDPCSQNAGLLQSETYAPTQSSYSPGVFCNPRPPMNKSYIVYDSTIRYDEENDFVVNVELTRNELQYPDELGLDGDPRTWSTATERVVRAIETRAGTQYITWEGYAERVGWTIPKPGKLRIVAPDGRTFVLTPVGKGVFAQKKKGDYFCQPVYAAAWKLRYQLTEATPVTPEDASGGVE